MWYHGDRIPAAYELCKNEREEREYQRALHDPNRCYGLGTEEDPLVVWLNRPEEIVASNRDQLWAHNNFAKAIAKVLGFTHTWVVKEAHDVEYARDAYGRRIAIKDQTPTSPTKFLTQSADMHITLRLGTGLYECRLSAHAYVQLDGAGHPEKYMTELIRRFRNQNGRGKGKTTHRNSGKDSSQIEFWPWVNYHRRCLPRSRPARLGPNWEVHANVGPYLDTYRPDSRLTCDTYTPRSRSTTPGNRTGYGEEDDDISYYKQGKIIEGTMTQEMERLVRKCNAAYEKYKALHMELVVLEDPPVEKLRELHAMREQVATMKREIYREAKGILE